MGRPPHQTVGGWRRRPHWVVWVGGSFLVAAGLLGVSKGAVTVGAGTLVIGLVLVALNLRGPHRDYSETMPKEVANTPTGLGRISSAAFSIAALLIVVGLTCVVGAIGTPVFGVFCLVTAAFLMVIGRLFGALARTAVRASSLLPDHEMVLAQAVGRAGEGTLAGGQVVMATEKRLLAVPARLVRRLEISAAIPYAELAVMSERQDGFDASSRKANISAAKCPPSQVVALAAEVHLRCSLEVAGQ
jgi:hypothetical protein